jgi:hypothetical protein
MTPTIRQRTSSVIIGSILASLALVLLSGCGQSTGQGTRPLSGRQSASVIIDWVDFVKFNGIMYVANIDSRASKQLVSADLGPQFATVQFKVDGNISDGNYRPKDGDAAFLDTRTPIYTVKGYSPTFLLTAYSNDQIIRYVADRNPSAKTGADLLDIGGKVTRIGINSETDGTTELAAIADPRKIQSLVALVLTAPVKQDTTQPPSGTRYFIAFHLRDGFTVTEVYWTKNGELSRGIMLPTAFRTAVEQAISAHT